MLSGLVYTLCALTSLLCALLLWRAYAKSRSNHAPARPSAK